MGPSPQAQHNGSPHVGWGTALIQQSTLTDLIAEAAMSVSPVPKQECQSKHIIALLLAMPEEQCLQFRLKFRIKSWRDDEQLTRVDSE